MAKYRYCRNPNIILSDLDDMVKDQEDLDYKELRTVLKDALEKYYTRNPFKAGRPVQYIEEDRENIRRLRKEGKTMKAIASEMRCSSSTVYRILNSKN